MSSRQSKRRSDHIRRRMDHDSQNWVNQASRRIVNPIDDPFIQRSPDAGSPENTGSSAIKRRLRPGWRLVSFMLVILFSFAIYTAWTSPLYKAGDIEISGIQRFSREQILGSINIQGLHIFAVEPKLIKKSLYSNFPELREIQINLSLPASISIQVTERQPSFAWQSKNFLLWIDTEGYLIPARGSADIGLIIQSDDLPDYQLKSSIVEAGTIKIVRDKKINKPLLSSLAFFAIPKQIDASLLSAILQLNAWMPAEKTLLHQKMRGLGWRDVRGWPVFVGSKLERINDKMLIYQTIIKELEKEGINPTLVSVEFLHAPYYQVD